MHEHFVILSHPTFPDSFALKSRNEILNAKYRKWKCHHHTCGDINSANLIGRGHSNTSQSNELHWYLIIQSIKFGTKLLWLGIRNWSFHKVNFHHSIEWPIRIFFSKNGRRNKIFPKYKWKGQKPKRDLWLQRERHEVPQRERGEWGTNLQNISQ